MSGKNNQNLEHNKNTSEKKQQKQKSRQNPKQNNKQQNKTNCIPQSSSNQQKNNNNLKSDQKTKSNAKNENKEKSKSNGKQKKKIEDKAKTNEVPNKQLKEQTVNMDENKNPKSEVVKLNLMKTDKKTLSPPQEFELSVEKIKKLENKGYKQLELLGEGSYGKVFKAKSSKHRKQVAIKAVDLKRLSDWFKHKYLSIEIELMKKIKEHKNVIKFYEVIEATDDHLLYIMMEFCPNGDLFDYIIRRHYIPEREACLWFRQLISGIEHIHNSGFAHRDIKCENLLLDHKYVIKIVDFGFCCKINYQKKEIKKEGKIVNIINDEIPSVTFCGSIVYSAPELLRGKPYLPTKADIWSCGVVLYVMLFGCYPNDGTELDNFIQLEEHRIEAPKSPEVSEECKELVKNILVDEENRYTVKDIKSNQWFKKKWKPIDNKIKSKEYFENLNIKRQETQEFEYIPETATQSVKSDDNSELKGI